MRHKSFRYCLVILLAAMSVGGCFLLTPDHTGQTKNIKIEIGTAGTDDPADDMLSEENDVSSAVSALTTAAASDEISAAVSGETEADAGVSDAALTAAVPEADADTDALTETVENDIPSESAEVLTEAAETPTEISQETLPASEAAPELWHMAEGPAKTLVRTALSYVSAAFGYSLTDRAGLNGHFDCSGFIAVLLRDALGEPAVGWFGSDPWDTAYWRYYGSCFNIGDVVTFGNAQYTVTMKDSYDFENAWAVPGSIVIQYPPENDPSVKMGHASVALGRIPYASIDDVVSALEAEYGCDLHGMAGGPNGIPKVYDQYGPDAGHTTWKVNANGIAECVCVDNNYASRPEWIEKIAVVFTPIQ